jgi:uncharacterized membrane protein
MLSWGNGYGILGWRSIIFGIEFWMLNMGWREEGGSLIYLGDLMVVVFGSTSGWARMSFLLTLILMLAWETGCYFGKTGGVLIAL